MLNLTMIKRAMDKATFKIGVYGSGLGFSMSRDGVTEVAVKAFRRPFTNKFNLTVVYDGNMYEGVISRNAYNVIAEIAKEHNKQVDAVINETKKNMTALIGAAIAMKDAVHDKLKLKMYCSIIDDDDFIDCKHNAIEYADEIGKEKVADFLKDVAYIEGVKRAI